MADQADLELKNTVRKDATPRLQAEMLVSQNIFDEKQVKNFSRNQLVSYVFALRKLAGQTNAVRTLVSGFDPNDVEIFGGNLDQELGATLSPKPTDPTQMFFAFFQQMQEKETRDRAAQEKQRDIDRAEREKQLTLALEKETRDRAEREKDRAAREKQLTLALEKETRDRAEREKERTLALEKENRDRDERKQKRLDKQAELAAKEARDLVQKNKDLEDAKAYEKTKIENEKQTRYEEYKERSKLEHEYDDEVRQKNLADKVAHDAKFKLEDAKFENRLTRASKALRGLVAKMPSDNFGVVLYLKQMDDIFDLQKIDADLRVSLISAYLSDKARKVQAALSKEDRENYDNFKAALLREFRVTARACRNEFFNASRNEGESASQFCNRLKIILQSYVDTRAIDNNYDNLLALILSD